MRLSGAIRIGIGRRALRVEREPENRPGLADDREDGARRNRGVEPLRANLLEPRVGGRELALRAADTYFRVGCIAVREDRPPLKLEARSEERNAAGPLEQGVTLPGDGASIFLGLPFERRIARVDTNSLELKHLALKKAPMPILAL